MRVLLSTGSPAGYMMPPTLGEHQVVCGPDWPDRTDSEGRVLSFATPAGSYDLAALAAAKLPAEQQPDIVVCLVDSSWRNIPGNLAAFKCPKVLLVADTHHLSSPLVGMLHYIASEAFDRVVFLYDRHHAGIFFSAGIRNLYWFPGLTLPHSDDAVRKARAAGPRSAHVAFVGQTGRHHPRRARLLDGLASLGLPVSQQKRPQHEALRFYGSSLLAFNASLNGDLNLRIFEILASGAALLTDRLAPQSGLGRLFPDDRSILTYGSAEELAELALFAITHPRETRARGASGARWFDAHLNESRRRSAFQALAIDGTEIPEFAFSAAEKTRVFFTGGIDRLVQAVTVYEGVQELHRSQESVEVATDTTVPDDVKALFTTIPRVVIVPAGEAAAADLAVVGRDTAHAGSAPNAPRVWCWNARPGDFDPLADHYRTFGYSLVSRNVAILCRKETAEAQGDASPETGQTGSRVARRSRDDGGTHFLLITDDPENGGVAHYNHSILLALARAGHRVSCLQTRSDGSLVREQRAAGVRHHWLAYDTGADFARTMTDVASPRELLETDRPDLIIFSDCCPFSNFAAREVARLMSIPYVSVVGFVGAYLARTFAAHLPLLARQYAGARAVVAVSHENLQLLRAHFGLGPTSGQVIHYGRPPRFFLPRDPAARDRLRGELGITGDAVVCFTAARLAAVKGHVLQLQALSSLRGSAAADNLHLVWAGEGDQRAVLEGEVLRLGLGDRVHLLGQRGDIDSWHDAADIFLLTSRLEGMPLAIMEAMAKAVPVIATAVSGIPEEMGETGRLLPDPSVDAGNVVRELAATLLEWGADPELRRAIGEHGRRRAEAMFREEQMLRRTLEMLERQSPAGQAASLSATPA
jgi:glycosyltransferase involved in cell wall biosynthesis